jgi:uncharacterized protein YqfA (UPF0365 family)
MKNIAIGILSIVSVGSLVFGYQQKSKLDSVLSACVAEKQQLEKLAQEQQLQARAERERAQVAENEAMIQRTICEEQLKALKASR